MLIVANTQDEDIPGGEIEGDKNHFDGQRKRERISTGTMPAFGLLHAYDALRQTREDVKKSY